MMLGHCGENEVRVGVSGGDSGAGVAGCGPARLCVAVLPRKNSADKSLASTTPLVCTGAARTVQHPPSTTNKMHTT